MSNIEPVGWPSLISNMTPHRMHVNKEDTSHLAKNFWFSSWHPKLCIYFPSLRMIPCGTSSLVLTLDVGKADIPFSELSSSLSEL